MRGVADTLARAIAPGVSEAIRQPVAVENRPGANGAIGADAVAKSPADGYTFLVTSGGAMTVDPFIYAKLPYDTQKDLAPVTIQELVSRQAADRARYGAFIKEAGIGVD